MDFSKLHYYALFLFLFVLAQGFSIWGQYVTLPFKNLSMWQAFKMAIPFAWLDWLILPFAIKLGDKYELVTPTQDIFLLIITQFSLVLVVNHFYLKQDIFTSDYIGFFLILAGFFISFNNIISKMFNIPIPKHPGQDEVGDKDEKDKDDGDKVGKDKEDDGEKVENGQNKEGQKANP
jgi:hypothetical protein